MTTLENGNSRIAVSLENALKLIEGQARCIPPARLEAHIRTLQATLEALQSSATVTELQQAALPGSFKSIDVLSAPAREILAGAEEVGKTLGCYWVSSGEMLLALCKQPGPVKDFLETHAVTPNDVEATLRRASEGHGASGPGSDGRVVLNAKAHKAVDEALTEAKLLGDDHIGPSHLLLGVRHAEGMGQKILAERGIGVETIKQWVESLPAAQR